MKANSLRGKLRPRLARLVAGLLFSLLTSCSPTATTPQYTVTIIDPVDQTPSWSPADSMIAFRRSVASSYGPAGVYVISSSGHGLRLVAPDSLGILGSPHFSPDGSHLVGVQFGQVATLDMATNTIVRRTYTSSLVNDAAWSPDGTAIVYSMSLLVSGQPPDSAGLHILDLTTGSDRTVLGGSTEPFGYHLHWSPADSLIAYEGDGIQVIRPDGSGLRQLTTQASGQHHHAPTWIEGGSRLLYFSEGDVWQTRVVNPDGTGNQRWHATYGDMYSISGNGQQVVFPVAVDQGNGRAALVLFVMDTYDATGGSSRPLTHYEP